MTDLTPQAAIAAKAAAAAIAWEETNGVAHHGPPILTRRELAICEAVALWIRTVRQARAYEADWLPGHPDFIKSRLFWRLRSGKQPLPHPPPTAYSCPWYEVVEEPSRPHWAFDGFVPPDVPTTDIERELAGRIVLAQCTYKLTGRDDQGRYLCTFGPWQFVAWRGPAENGTHEGWWVQRLVPPPAAAAPAAAQAT